LLNTPALLGVVVAEFEGALTKAYHTTKTTREVELQINRLPDEY
jgi:hypothetical protein